MGLYQQPGYKRLAITIPIVVFVGALITMGFLEETFGASCAVSVVFSILSYAVTRLVYWIIDGFKSHK